jgi:hypothetical protein
MRVALKLLIATSKTYACGLAGLAAGCSAPLHNAMAATIVEFLGLLLGLTIGFAWAMPSDG